MSTKEQSGERVAAELATWFGKHFDALDMNQQDFGVQWEGRAGESFSANTLSSRVSELKNGNSKGITFFLSDATRREAFLDMFTLDHAERQDAEDLIERYFAINRGDARSIAVVIDLHDPSSSFQDWFGERLATLADEAKGRVVIVLSPEDYRTLPRGWDDFADFEQADFETDAAFLEWCSAEAPQAVVVSSRLGIPWNRWIAIDFYNHQMHPDSLADLCSDINVEHPVLDVSKPKNAAQDITVFESLGIQGWSSVEQRIVLDQLLERDLPGETPYVEVRRDVDGGWCRDLLTLEQRARIARLFSLPLSSTAEERERARNEAEVKKALRKLPLKVKRIEEEELVESREVLRWGELAEDALAIKLEKGRLKLVMSTAAKKHSKAFENNTAIECEFVDPIESGFFDWFLQELAEWTAADTHVDPIADRIYKKLLERTQDKHISGYFRARFIHSMRLKAKLEGDRLEEGAIPRLQSILSSELPEVELSLSNFDNLGTCYVVDDCVVPTPEDDSVPLVVAAYSDLTQDNQWGSRANIYWGLERLPNDDNRLFPIRLGFLQTSSVELTERKDELRGLAHMKRGEFERTGSRWGYGWHGSYDREPKSERWASLNLAPPTSAANDLVYAVLGFLRQKLSGEEGLVTSEGLTVFGEQFGGSIRVKISEHPLSVASERPRLIVEGCVVAKAPETTKPYYGHVEKAAAPYLLKHRCSGGALLELSSTSWASATSWPARILIVHDTSLFLIETMASRL